MVDESTFGSFGFSAGDFSPHPASVRVSVPARDTCLPSHRPRRRGGTLCASRQPSGARGGGQTSCPPYVPDGGNRDQTGPAWSHPPAFGVGPQGRPAPPAPGARGCVTGCALARHPEGPLSQGHALAQILTGGTWPFSLLRGLSAANWWFWVPTEKLEEPKICSHSACETWWSSQFLSALPASHWNPVHSDSSSGKPAIGVVYQSDIRQSNEAGS